jgi:beta-N-acetylhexosaminidase
MTVAASIGQVLAGGFEGPAPDPDLLARIRAGRLGTVVLFSRNVEAPAQLAALVAELQAAAPQDRPLLVAVDQEGGRVRRLREPWAAWPAAARMGASGDPVRVRAAGRAIGEELASCGIHLDLAPVLDVHTNPANPIIGDRAFGTTPEVVIQMAGAFAGGLADAGVAACGKHFPGHGDTEKDSHLELPRVSHGRARLLAVELAPFAALAPVLPAIMSAHIDFPALDPALPGTLSPAILTGLLRQRLGFGGVVVSDDLEMRAVADHYPPGVIAVTALEAGADLLAFCRESARVEAAEAALRDRAAADPAFAARLDAASARIRGLKARYCRRPPPDPRTAEAVAAREAHHVLAAALA